MTTSPLRAKAPVIVTEIRGVHDLWGQTLADYWDVIWPCDGITGVFIWEWQDQGQADKFPERWSIPSPGAQPQDTATGMRPEGSGGPLTPDRQIKPEKYWNLKMVYSPVNITAREIDPAAGQCVVPIQNRYSFTDLGELTCHWQALAGEKVLASGESHIAAKPLSTVNAALPATAGMDTLRLEFFHPDGRSVYAARLHTKGYQGFTAPAALAAAGPVRLSDSEQTVTVQTAGTELVLDKRKGQITSWRAGDQIVVLGGPILNLGETYPVVVVRGGPMATRGRGPAIVTSSQPPQYRNVAVTAKMDGANAKIAVAANVYLTGSEELKGQLTYTLNIGPDAQADLAWKLDWKAADATAREAGMRFLVPAAADRMSWFRDSLYTEYPAGHIAAPRGAVTSKEAYFSALMRGVRWVALSGAGKYCVVAMNTSQPLHTHGRVEDNGITLFLSSAMASTSYGVPSDDMQLTRSKALTGGFRLRVARGDSGKKGDCRVGRVKRVPPWIIAKWWDSFHSAHLTARCDSQGKLTKRRILEMTMLRHLFLALILSASILVPAGFAAPVPVPGDAPVAVERLRVGNPAVLPMAGTWRFKLDHGTSPAVKGELPADAPLPAFAAPDAADADWKTIPVPANWEVEGFSIPTYQERSGKPSTDIGLYRRWVEIPASFAGQHVLWHFDGAYDGAEVFVNGQRCGYHESGFTAFDIDVTKALKPGQRNLMAVRLYKNTSSASLDHGDFWCLGGIYRETYLVALPPLHVDDVTVVTDLDAQYKDATLTSTVRVAGLAGARISR